MPINPDNTLSEIRELTTRLIQAANGGLPGESHAEVLTNAAEDGKKLAQKVYDLDEWLCQGGKKPKGW
jgi:hypothetical protein